MKFLKLLILIIMLTIFSGCGEKYIVGSDGGKYVLIEPAVEPSEKNGWVGHVDFYRKEGDDTIHIMTFNSNPPIFQDIHQPID
jgi:hypothetical protein